MFIISFAKLLFLTVNLLKSVMDKFNVQIETKKNLLAFSAGIDSTALFFILMQNGIDFDIAIVDYNQRKQSKDEVIYATQLAHKYKKKCFIEEFKPDQKFNEKSARDFRYKFFDKIMITESYEALITAHQLNDKLEWFLMQLSKGAGLSELLGMEKQTSRDNYLVIKPLLEYSKRQLQDYLDEQNIKYFIDDSNMDQKYKRNYFRHNFSDKFLDNFQEGVSKSFEYLQNDLDSLFDNIKVERYKLLCIYRYNSDKNIALRIIDKELKQRGIVISKATRDEILLQRMIVISHKIAVALEEDKIWIAPFIKVKMDKRFKDKCRRGKIPENIRGYISTLDTDIELLFSL